MTELVLVPGSESGTQRDIVITQTDVRNVQLGKAALRAGIDILLREQAGQKSWIASISPVRSAIISILPTF